MKLLDVVALVQDLPDRQLYKGQVGTIIEELDKHTALVEFAELNGVAYAIQPIHHDLLMQLYHAPKLAA